jgi:hypothetical protein
VGQPVFLGPLHPRHGPHDPTGGTPDRVPGSVRRTVTTDMLRPDGMQGPLVLLGRARDLRTHADGRPEVLAEATMELTVDWLAGWSVTGVRTDPDRPALQAVLGATAGAGFRRRVAQADPELPNLLHQLLDDVPVTTLVSGMSWAAEAYRTGEVRTGTSGRAMFGRDNCAGYVSGGTVMSRTDDSADGGGVPPLPTGPFALPLTTDDPSAWHDLPELPPHGMRRARRTDVLPGPRPRIDVFYRDSWMRPDGVQTVIHEYTVDAEVDPERNELASCRATPRALPWLECPSAAASAERLAGVSLDGLRRHVRRTFAGPSTCTHLNDTLRSLEDVPALLAQLPH